MGSDFMSKVTIDDLIDITHNNYILTEVVSKRARQLQKSKKIELAYVAIDEAIDDLHNDRFQYEMKK